MSAPTSLDRKYGVEGADEDISPHALDRENRVLSGLTRTSAPMASVRHAGSKNNGEALWTGTVACIVLP